MHTKQACLYSPDHKIGHAQKYAYIIESYMQNLIPVCMYDENESHGEAAEISMVPFPAGLFSHTPLHTVVPDS